MEISSAKAIEIDSYIRDNEKDCLQYNKLAIQLKGERRPLEVYKLPIELLIYNKRNGRFAAEILHKQDEIRRELDPSNAEDRKIIKELLLREDENATKLLKDDLIKVGQLEPGIITFDGVVINANRRMAVFEDLLEETSDSKYGFLTVARLPKNVDEKEIYRLEIDLQLSRPYRKEYGPINELLKVQEGLKIGFTPKQIASSLFGGFTEDDIKERLDRLKLIEDYLEYIEKPGEYEEVKGLHEHFIDLQDDLSTLKKKKMNAKEIYSATITGFQLIIADVPHMDVRIIKNLMAEKNIKESLMESVEKVDRILEDTQNVQEEGKEEQKEVEPKKTYKKRKPKALIKIAEEFKEDFKELVDTYKAHKESDKPKTLLKRALSNLESIDPKNPNLKDTEIIRLLKNIVEIATKLIETK